MNPLAPNARQIVNNLMLLADGTVLAGYRIGTDRWDFTGNDVKSGKLDAIADVWASLAPRQVIERVTTRPYPVQQWARRLDLRTPQPVADIHTCDPRMWTEIQRLVGECGCETWNAHLARMQHRIARAGLDDKIVYRYFSVGQVKPRTDLRAAVLSGSAGRKAGGVRDVLEEELRVAGIVAAWRATRMTERQQAWLRLRSLAPGVLPAPPEGAGGWDEESLPALADDIRWTETPFGRTVSIFAWVNGEQVERAVQILSVSRLNDLAYPGNGLEPWQTFAERAVGPDGVPFPVEWSLTGELVTGGQIAQAAERNLRLMLNLQRDYRSHDEPPPEYTDRGITSAKRVRDEVTTGQAAAAARFVGTINAIVSAPALLDADGTVIRSAAEVTEMRAAALRRLFAGPELRMEMSPVQPQSIKLAETIPGEPRERLAYQRQVPLGYLAAGLPTATSGVGDNAGPYVGYTRGAARRAVMHDPHYATEGQGGRGRQQNMWVVSGTLGAGKSVLLGSIIYNAVRRGQRVVASDPSGPLAKLCRMPEIAAVSREINLLQGQDGILNPPSLIREPLPSDFDAEGEWQKAVVRAQGERRDLIVDAARRCLTPDLYRDPRTFEVLTAAARRFQWTMHSSMWHLIERLSEMGDDHASRVRDGLLDAASTPMLSLLFAPRLSFTPPATSDALLTVISTPGVRRAPDEVQREDWNPGERGADVVLRLSAFYTDRLIYGKPRDARALAIFDEAEDLTDFGAGRGFLARLGRDHSKWNTAVYLAVKSINQAMLSGEVRNFLAGAFVGRMANQGAAEDMLDVLNVTDRKYATILMRLSEVAPGEFVHLDADGNVSSVRVDVDYHEALKEALLTNPAPEGADGWRVSPEEVL